MKRIFVLLILAGIWFLNSTVQAQETCEILDSQQPEFSFKTKNVNSFLDSLNHIGFYTLKIDSTQENPCKIYIEKGKQFKQILIKNPIPKPSLFLTKNESENGFLTLNLDAYISELKDSLNQIGEPFTVINLIPKGYENEWAALEIQLDKTQTTRHLDDLKFVGYEKFPKFIKNDLLKKKLVFTEENVKKIKDEISDLGINTWVSDPKVSFTQDSTVVYLYPKKIKQNYFNGLLGFGTDENNKIQLQGNIEIRLNNAFNLLEQLTLNWQSAQNKSQFLETSANFPRMFKSKFGYNTNLQIQKQDSTFLRLQWRNGVSYQFGMNHFIAGNWNYASSNYISNQDYNPDFNKSGFGITYNFLNGNVLGLLGNKTWVNLSTAYWKRKMSNESIKTDQTELIYQIQRQQKIWKNHYAFARLMGKNLIQEGEVLENDNYYFGGFNDLRGFNQNSISTDAFNLISMSYRYVPNDKILFETFYDFALLNTPNGAENIQMSALGIGTLFQTKVGLFQINYAIGKSEDQPFDFNNGKIHLGIRNQF